MNLKFHTKWLLIIGMLIGFQSIGQAEGLTSVGTHHIIGLSYKNDCILSLGGRVAGDYYTNITAQAGFAYNNFLAFQIGYHYFEDNPYLYSYSGTNYTGYFNDDYAHAAVGVFYPIPIKNSKIERLWKNKGTWYSPRHILLDVYMAYGKGLNKRSLELDAFNSGTAIFNNLSSNSTINFNKWYVEGGLHYKGHVFGASISGVLGILNFRKMTVVGAPDEELLNLIRLFREDASYYTYGYQFKTWVSFNTFTILYHNHQNFISKQDFLNYNLNNYSGELSVQVNINQLLRKMQTYIDKYF